MVFGLVASGLSVIRKAGKNLVHQAKVDQGLTLSGIDTHDVLGELVLTSRPGDGPADQSNSNDDQFF
jgi:hypothetical protein